MADFNAPIPLIGPAWNSRSKDISAQITRNLYPEINPEGKSVVSLHAFPGMAEWCDLMVDSGTDGDAGPHRGLTVVDNQLIVINGNRPRYVNSDGVATYNGLSQAAGDVDIDGEDRVDIANNGSQVFIANGKDLFLMSPSASFPATYGRPQRVTDSDVVDPSTLAYINGQFVFDDTEGTNFKTSQTTSALSVSDLSDAVDVASAESFPDPKIRIIAHNQMVYFFGLTSREAWYNSGQGSPPFDRVQSSVRNEGIAGKWAVTADKDAIFFLDNSRTPRILRGFDSVPLGNPPLGKELQSYARVDDCRALVYTLDNQRFFELVFPSADRSWCWHEPSSSWFELCSGVNRTRHLADQYVYVYGKHLVAHPTDGKLYELDFDTFTDAGLTVQRVRRTATIHGGLYGRANTELIFERVYFDLEVGVGIATGQGSDPQVMIRYSDDGGRTWSAEMHYPLGAGGDYLRRVCVTQQGRSYKRVYELAVSDPVRVSLIGASADLSFAT